MGALDGDPNADRDERPRHRVIISKPFYFAAYELTTEKYVAIMGAQPPTVKEDGERIRSAGPADISRWPVMRLTYEEAAAVAATLSNFSAEKAAGRNYRMPTEAEWEYACRAGSNSIFIDSDTLTISQANFASGKVKRTESARWVNVGLFPPNPWGLYDTIGNAREWCSDFKGEYPGEMQTDPQGPRVGKHHVIRGGNFLDSAADCRVSARYRIPADQKKDFKPRAGARIVCVVNK